MVPADPPSPSSTHDPSGTPGPSGARSASDPPGPLRPSVTTPASAAPPETGSVTAAGHLLDYQVFGAASGGRPRVVLLHEGLGCIAMWRGFPAQLAARLGEPVLVYSRYGYGRSEVLQSTGRDDRFMHDEALVALPELLDRFGIDRPVLIGHSDGASIALIHAGLAGRTVAAVAVLAPHLFVEPVTVASIRLARRLFDEGDLAARLARYHTDVRRTFDGWCDTWLRPDFERWNIEDAVARIRCPLLAIQGVDDEYGTLAQIERIGALCPQARIVALPDCRHSPHLDQSERTLDEIARLLASAQPDFQPAFRPTSQPE